MNAENIRRELVILLAHFIRKQQPEIYKKFAEFCDDHSLYPSSCQSLDDALDLRFKNFPVDQFQHFIKSLLPTDDFPSIFRRIRPFDKPKVSLPFEVINPIKRVCGHKEPIYCLATDQLGRILATGADDYKIKLWKLPDMDPICTLSGHENCVTNVCFNPLCTLLLSSSHDNTIRIWSLIDGSCIATLCNFTTSFVHSAIFSPSGSMIAAACEDGTIPIWITADALQSLGPYRTISTVGKGPAAWVAFSPGGEFLSYTCEPSCVVVIALKTMTTFNLELHSALVGLTLFTSSYFVNGAELAPRLITASNEEGIAAVWEMENFVFKPKYIFKQANTGRRQSKIQQLKLDADEHLLVISKNNGVFIYDTYSGECISQLPHIPAFDECTCIAANPVYREVFFFGNSTGYVAIADVHNNTILSEMKCAEDVGFLDAVWSKDGKWIYACDASGSVTIFCTSYRSAKIREIFPDFTTVEFYDDENNPGQYVDQNGNKIKQPRHHDIRTLNLEVMSLQAPFFRNCAIELNLIQRMSAPDRHTITSSTSTPAIGPPPLHVHISHEYPVNPRGSDPNFNDNKSMNKAKLDDNQYENDIDDIEEKNLDAVEIVSEAEDWLFLEDGKSDIESFYNNDFSEDVLAIYSNDVPKNIWPEWTYIVATDDNSYFPQVGDEAIFFYPSYMKMLESTEIQAKTIEKLPEQSRCYIQQISSNSHGFQIMLSSPSFSNMISVVFPIPVKIAFLIPIQIIKNSKQIAKKLRVGDAIVISHNSDENKSLIRKGEIAEINPKFNISPYESIKVIWENSEESLISPWEISCINGQKVNFNDSSNKLDGINQAMISIIDSLINEGKYAHLRSCNELLSQFENNHDDLEQMTSKISMPMSLNLLKERLINSYYHSIESIYNDIQLLSLNASVLYGDGSPNEKSAKELQSYLKKSVENLSRQFRDRRNPKK